jgi:hypothetical protein
MKSVSRTQEPVQPAIPRAFSGLLKNWVQSLYDKVHDPAHCSRCGVYLPARNRICEPCAREG